MPQVVELNNFYDVEALEPEEPPEGVETSIIYKFDYPEGIIYIYELHKWDDGNIFTHYRGDINISQLKEEQTRKIWETGRASYEPIL